MTVFGESSDNATTRCEVYTDWNRFAPFQKAIPTGGDERVENEDYSNWASHFFIVNGNKNNLTASIVCFGDISSNFNSSSINVIGIAEKHEPSPTFDEDIGDMNVTGAADIDDLGGTVFVEPGNDFDEDIGDMNETGAADIDDLSGTVFVEPGNDK